MNLQQIGRKISELRRQRDMTQNDLAEKAGVSYQAVSSWERGLTMPDISKLPGISQILGVSIDQLLDNDNEVELVKNILNQNTAVYAEEKELHIDEIVEVAPLLKPSQVDDLARHTNKVEFHQLVALAPFLSQEALNQLAENVVDAGDFHELCEIAPFLGKEYLDKMALQIVAAGSIHDLVGIAPFLSKEVLNQLAENAVDACDIHDLVQIAPFLKKKHLDDLALKIGQTGNIHDLLGLAPFISRDVLDQIVLRSCTHGFPTPS